MEICGSYVSIEFSKYNIMNNVHVMAHAKSQIDHYVTIAEYSFTSYLLGLLSGPIPGDRESIF